MESYEIKNPEIEAVLRELGEYLKGRMPKDWGFTLLMQSHGEAGATFYISSVEREGALDSMIEFLRKQGKIPVEGAVPSLTAADLGIVQKPKAESAVPVLSNDGQKIHDAMMVLVRTCMGGGADHGHFVLNNLMLNGVKSGNWNIHVGKMP